MLAEVHVFVSPDLKHPQSPPDIGLMTSPHRKYTCFQVYYKLGNLVLFNLESCNHLCLVNQTFTWIYLQIHRRKNAQSLGKPLKVLFSMAVPLMKKSKNVAFLIKDL